MNEGSTSARRGHPSLCGSDDAAGGTRHPLLINAAYPIVPAGRKCTGVLDEGLMHCQSGLNVIQGGSYSGIHSNEYCSLQLAMGRYLL